MKNSGGIGNKKGVIKCLLAVIFMIAAIVGFANSKSIMNYAKQFFAAGEAPAHEKTRTDNEINGQSDGTYKLSLSVTGDADTDVETAANVNVLVILDTSSSMTTYNAGTGTNPPRRADAAEKVVYDFTHSLFGYQNKTDGSNIQMSLVTFDAYATTKVQKNWTSTESDITGLLSPAGTRGSAELDYHTGTNWEAGLRTGINEVLSVADNDPTFVLFVTDGAPYRRMNDQGTGQVNTDMLTGYQAARDEARAASTYKTGEEPKGDVTFYGIYAYGDEGDYLDDLVYYALNGSERATVNQYTQETPNYYNASDTQALTDAISEIFNKIVNALGISSAKITDGTTNQVKSTSGKISSLLNIDETSYEYWLTVPVVNNQFKRIDLVSGDEITYTVTDNNDGTLTINWGSNSVTVNGKFNSTKTNFKYKWTAANSLYNFAPPQAELKDGAVEWDLSSVGTLLDGVKYEVTFDVYPSQTTYDYIADLENGVIEYADLPEEVQPYIHEVCESENNCSYFLDTNTEATLSYDDTRDEAGTQTVSYDNPDPVPTIAEKISISKEWDNTIDDRDKHEVKVKLLKSKDDGEGFEDFCFTAGCDATLSNNNNFKLDNIRIATGLARLQGGELTILDKGHDYKFDELGPESYYWQLETEVVHPMIINGTLTKLILVEDESIVSQMGDATYKEIGGKKYYQLDTGKVYVDAGEGPNIKAENHRRSNLNVTKIVDGPTADSDEEFTFTINVVQKDDEGNVIPSTDTVDHNDYLWFSVLDKDGNSVVFENTPTGWTPAGSSYYAPNETSLTVKLKAGYNLRFFNLHTGTTFDITETDIANYKLDSLTEKEEYKETAEGSLIKNTIKTVKDSNKISGTIDENNRSYTVEAKNIYEKVSAKVKKDWPDDNENEEGLRKPITFNLKNSKGEIVDTVVLDGTVDENGETEAWFGEFEDQTRFVEGEEETYTIEEDLSEIEDHYTSTISPEDGVANNGLVTVTNKRIPDDIYTKVEGEKIWDDKDNQDNLRPATITINLLKKGTKIDSKVVNIDPETGEGKYSWTKLPKYENGEEIVYSVTEEAITYYEPEYISGTYDIKNKHNPFTTELSVTKSWSDAKDIDGIRPDSVAVQLYVVDKNGNELPQGDPVTLDESNNWSHTFTELPRKAAGQDITYIIKEVPVPTGYTESYTNVETAVAPEDGSTNFNSKPLWTVTNSHTPEPTEISVEKVWDDADDQDGIRPNSIQVQLLKDGKAEGDPITLNEGNEWKYSWTDLAKYEFEEDGVTGGKLVEYSVQELTTSVITGTDGPNTYKFEVTGDAKEGYTITNKHTPETTEVSVTKSWDDKDDQDGIRPNEVTVQLYADGTATGDPVTLNKGNDWTYTWTDLAKNKNDNGEGVEIAYTVDETSVPTGYTHEVTGSQEDGYTVTNKHTPGVTTITVTKAWDDADDQDGIRPDAIDVQLLADGTATGNPVTLNEDNSWTYTWTDLPVNKAGTPIEYTVDETEVPDDYAKTITGDATAGYTITNKHVPEVTTITVTKAWDDADDQDGIRPDDIQAQLYADGSETGNPVTLNEDNSWTYTWSDLPVNKDGEKITYTVDETEVPDDYAKTITGDATAGFTIKNKHVPEVTSIKVTKAWVDNDDQDGIRPDSIEVQLFADGQELGKTEELNEDNSWTYTWTGLDKYKDGELIEYTVDETEVPEGYTKESITGDATAGFTIKNVHVTEETAVKVTKAWDDADDQDGLRPDSIEVQLYADGTAEGDPVTLDESNNWTKTWSNLPVNNAGSAITYTVDETEVPEGYEREITGAADTGFTITNTHVPETTTISGDKEWNDKDNQDGLRPEKITINLFADGEKIKSEQFDVNPDTGECNYSFTGLPKYKIGDDGKGGHLITYTITEDRVSDYEEPTYTGDNDLHVINKHNPFETEVSVKKSWNDADDIDGKRPTSITVRLWADGIPYSGSTTVTLDESNNWSYTWSGLPRKASGQDIEYTVKELVVPDGYTSNVDNPDVDPTPTTTPDGTTYIIDEAIEITNEHTPEPTEVSVEKVWDDKDNQDGNRPVSVNIKLLADGEETGNSITLSEQNEWKHTWTDLPKYEFDEEGKGGKEIEYTVEESKVPDKYTAEVTGTAEEGFTVTNKYTPEETSLKVTKVWDDKGDQDGIRPSSIQVQLTADGTAQGDPVTLDESNNWTYTWTGLAKNKNVQGEVSAITYKADEVTVPQGYDKSTTGDISTGITITNKYTPKVTNVEGTKTWDDSNNVDGKRPSSIKVYVKDGDTIVDTITVTGDATKESWTYKSKDLPKYRNHGKEEIAYTIEEETTGLVEIGYSVEIDGTNITNSRTPEVIEEFPITKSWIDNSNSEGFRPNSVDIQLLADGQPYGEPITIGTDKDGNPLEGTTIEGNNWKYVFKNLPKYTHDENGNGGKEIVYSIKEVNLDANYKAEQVDNRTIVNTIDAMKKDIPVKKVWDDASNQDGYRPDSIEFTLTGTVESETEPVYTDKITLNGESDTWEGKFIDAPIFYKGTLITYTVNEVVTKDLQTYYPETKEETVEGVYTITNKHVPEVTEVTIGKTWDDKDDQDGKRPASIEVTLTGNGKTYGPVKIGLDENGNPLEGTIVDGNTWKYTFTDLPKKADGKDIEYVVSESNVDNYNQLSIISNVITNQHIPATISYSVEKEWDDFDNQDGKRPEFITVTLTGKVGDTVVYTSTITVKPDDNGDWKYSFTGLDKYYQKQLIQYTLTEGNVDLYETDPIVDIPNEEGTTTINNTIINRHELETIDITVKKVWDDLDNKYNHRTTFVTVHLFADGEEVDEAMLTEANGWTTIFEGLVKYREGKEGEEVVYTITEDAVEFYKTSYAEADNVFTITNTYDGPTDSEIVPPKTGILPTQDYTFFELLMNLILLSYSLVYLKKVEN